MRYYCFQLCIKHPLPTPIVTETAPNGQCLFQQYFHTIIPVGTALVPATSDNLEPLIHLVNSPESFLFEVAFAQTHPVDRASFMRMIESIAETSNLLCYRVETIEIGEDADPYETFDERSNLTERAYYEASISLYTEVYERN
jgi:hypothetical protein